MISPALTRPLRTETQARAEIGVSVVIRGDSVLLIRHGQREGFTRCGDMADELPADRARVVAMDILAAVNVIETRKAKET